MLGMIVACDRNGAIGKDGDLPWRQSTDLQHFKTVTMGSNLIMGRKTWDSLPDAYQPLPERVNIVMSRDMDWSHPEAETALYQGRAIEIAYAEACDECWVIGGAQIYEMFLDRVEEIHVTTVHTTNSGDVQFPEWNREGWNESVIETIEADDDNEFSTTYSIWTKS